MSQRFTGTKRSIYEIVTEALDHHQDTVTLVGEGFVDVDPKIKTMRTLRLKGPEGRFDLRYVMPEAQPAFEWVVEITLDPAGGKYQHFLLRVDGSLVEAYGRNLFPVSPQAAKRLEERLLGLLG